MFDFETNWIAITGAPSSGKTSVIDALARRGYSVQAEVARELIEDSLKHGLSLQEARADAKGLQTRILDLKIQREAALDPAACVFMDRGMPDSISYFRLAGMDTQAPIRAALRFKYRAVFIFNRLPLVKDDVRSEDEALADKIDGMLEEDYKSLGYAPVRVPVISVEARADFILSLLPPS